MQDVTFINTQYIKTKSGVNINVDDKQLIPAIVTAQEDYILDSLGSGLYNELQYQISANTLTNLNRTLIEQYIQPALLWFTVSDGIPMNHYKIDAKGVQKMDSENQIPVEKNELIWLQEFYMNKAEKKNQRLIKYLCQNQASFPLYTNPGNGVDTIHPTKDGFKSSGGIYFYDDIYTNENDD